MNRLQVRLAGLVFLAAFLVAGALLPLAIMGDKMGLHLGASQLARDWWRGLKLTLKVVATGRRKP